jgi:lipopolysaccharide export system permease protein
MTILFRYLGKTIFQTIGIVVSLLVGLEIFILAVSQLDELGRGAYHLQEVFLYVMGNLPLELYNFFPLAALLGVILGLGILASNSELIVMQASGLSIARITGMVMKIALFLIVLVSLMGEILGPTLSHRAQEMKTRALSLGQAVKTAHGTWVRNDNRYIRIDRVEGKNIFGVTIYDFNDAHQMMRASYAKTGTYHHSMWLLEDVSQSEIGEKQVLVTHLPTWEVKLTLHPKMLGVDQMEPTHMDLINLYRYIRYRQENGLQIVNYALVFWQRIFQPVSTAMMMLLAIPFIFGPLRSATMGHRVLIGVTVGFAFYLFNQFLGPISLVYEIPPMISAIIPTLFFGSIGFMVYRFSKNHR